MIARHENSAFAGGALVFPGGRVDPGDCSPAWRDYAEKLSEDERTAASQIAAIRETFEETGVLLARHRSGAAITGDEVLALGDWRKRFDNKDSIFLDFIRCENLRLSCDRLTKFAHWVPPVGLHKRFDTLFFLARFPDGQTVVKDGNEATEALWIEPKKAIEAREFGARKIIFPTLRNLELLALSRSVESAVASTRSRLIVPVTPVVVKKDGGVFLSIPEGLGYPVTEEPLERATRG